MRKYVIIYEESDYDYHTKDMLRIVDTEQQAIDTVKLANSQSKKYADISNLIEQFKSDQPLKTLAGEYKYMIKSYVPGMDQVVWLQQANEIRSQIEDYLIAAYNIVDIFQFTRIIENLFINDNKDPIRKFVVTGEYGWDSVYHV